MDARGVVVDGRRKLVDVDLKVRKKRFALRQFIRSV